MKNIVNRNLGRDRVCSTCSWYNVEPFSLGPIKLV